MATIYQKTASDRTLILSPREYFLRPFDFGTDWTEVRVGIFFSGVTSGGDNTQAVSETVAVSSAIDRIAFGIKDSATAALPGQAGSLFIGSLTATTRDSESNGSDFQGSAIGALAAGAYNGVTLVGGATGQELGNSMAFGGGVANASAYCGFYAVQFVIANRGLATQTVTVRASSTSAVAGTDYSATNLRTYLNAGPWTGTAHSLAWNDGAAAYPLPDAVYIRMPFYNNRIRISAIRAIRYAP
jgi:hypothetical protein